MVKNNKYQFGFILIFMLALLLRLGLALVNRESNDNHVEVVRMIMETHRLPVMGECRECFHPKLFYVTAAALLQVFGIHDLTAQIIFVQILNFLAGLVTLAVIARFIKEYPSSNEPLKLAVFVFIALNPKIVAINAQASNDSFAILFTTLALFFNYRFFKNSSLKYLGLLIFFILLAVSTKVTSWIAFVAIFLGFLVHLWVQHEKFSRKLIHLSIPLVTVFILTTLNPLSQFITNTEKFGSPIVSRDKRLPLPGFFAQTTHYKDYYFRPGIVSIQDGFFTFKLADLLKYPLTTNGEYNYPPQRTSFWTMLYADSHSLHFQNWPPSWQTTGVENFGISRGIFILALLPTLVLIAGLLLELYTLLKAIFKKDKPKILATGNALFLLTFGGYIAFLILACLLYRDFAFIKLAYILPGLLAFTWLFLHGGETVFEILSARARWATWLASGWMIVLLGFYINDVLAMISQLYTANIHY
jgi:hypothetical protein